MTEPTGPEGQNGNPSGDADPKTVSYDTHRQLLGEKKKAAEKAARLEQELEDARRLIAERDEKDLTAQKKFEDLHKKAKEDLENAQKKIAEFEHKDVTTKKLDAFFRGLGSPLDRKFWALIELDEITYDKATGQVDMESVTKVVETFKKTYPETMGKAGNGAAGMPSENPKGGSGKLTVEQWQALPYKEKMSRLHEVAPLKKA